MSASLHLEHCAAVVVLQSIRYSLGLQIGVIPHCSQLTVLEVAAYFPSSHSVHTVAPVDEAYVPATHPTQSLELSEPFLDENVPAIQYSHLVKPEALE